MLLARPSRRDLAGIVLTLATTVSALIVIAGGHAHQVDIDVYDAERVPKGVMTDAQRAMDLPPAPLGYDRIGHNVFFYYAGGALVYLLPALTFAILAELALLATHKRRRPRYAARIGIGILGAMGIWAMANTPTAAGWADPGARPALALAGLVTILALALLAYGGSRLRRAERLPA